MKVSVITHPILKGNFYIFMSCKMLKDISPRRRFRHPMLAIEWFHLEMFGQSKIRFSDVFHFPSVHEAISKALCVCRCCGTCVLEVGVTPFAWKVKTSENKIWISFCSLLQVQAEYSMSTGILCDSVFQRGSSSVSHCLAVLWYIFEC